MIPAIQGWSKAVYQNQNYSSLGSLPLQPMIATIAVADAVFHYVAVRNPEFCQKAKKYEWVFYWTRIAALTWSVGHLFETVLSNRSSNFDWLKQHFFLAPSVSAVMLEFVEIIHDRIKKEQWNLTQDMSTSMPKGVSVNIANPEQHLPKAPLWVVALQQVTYVSLAVFSKSHLMFASLSALYLYSFYESVQYTSACLRQMIITMKFKYLERCFEYKEHFAAGENAKKEASSEIKRLCQEVANFKPFNFQQSEDGKSCTMHCLTMSALASNPGSLGQLSGSQLYMRGHLGQEIECNFIHLPYQQGMKISVQIDMCNTNSKTLHVALDNGTIVKFPNVCTSQILKMGAKTIEATIESIVPEKGQVYLYCSSTELPKAEKLAFTWNKKILEKPFTLDATVYICEKGKSQAPCSKCESVSNLFHYEAYEPYSAVCKSCITADFKNRVKNFTIVNDININPLSELFGHPIERIFAQKDQLPEGSRLNMKDSKNFSVNINWLDYPVGKKVNVQLREVVKNTALGHMPDGTIVSLPAAKLEMANEIIQTQKTIDAQIFEKSVMSDRLFLFCISRTVPPKSIPLDFMDLMQLDNGTHLRRHFIIDLKPVLSDQDKICNICTNPSEILFYECADKTHTACIPCLHENLKVQCSKLKILNLASGNVRNQEDQLERVYQCCFDKESLPNCLYCRSPVVDNSQLSVMVENVKARVLFLNYKIDDIVQFRIQGFYEDGTPYGQLDDGTLVVVKDAAHIDFDFLILRIVIRAKIQKKIVENGRLCLICGIAPL